MWSWQWKRQNDLLGIRYRKACIFSRYSPREGDKAVLEDSSLDAVYGMIDYMQFGINREVRFKRINEHTLAGDKSPDWETLANPSLIAS